MVSISAFIVLLIFTLEATPFAPMLMFGASSTLIYAAVIGLAALSLVAIKRIKFTAIVFILLALAINEFVMGNLHGIASINFVRITAASLAAIMIFSSVAIYDRTIDFVKVSHALVVYGFLITVLAVAILGTNVLHLPYSFSDESVFRKVDYMGELRLRSLLIFNFTLNATPTLNVLDLDVLPSGVAPEPHINFSFMLVCMLLLMRSGRLSKRLMIASIAALVLSLSSSNTVGLAAAVLVTALLYMFNNFSSRRMALSLLLLTAAAVGTYIWQTGLLTQGSVSILFRSYDRSIAESYATIVRFFAVGSGTYPLEAVPHYFNDFRFFPLSFTSFLLFVSVLAAIFWRLYKVAKQLLYVDIFLLSYAFAYSLKSFGVMIFQPYIILAILIVLYRTELAVGKRPTQKARATSNVIKHATQPATQGA